MNRAWNSALKQQNGFCEAARKHPPPTDLMANLREHKDRRSTVGRHSTDGKPFLTAISAG
jgi:hypothetical protein